MVSGDGLVDASRLTVYTVHFTCGTCRSITSQLHLLLILSLQLIFSVDEHSDYTQQVTISQHSLYQFITAGAHSFQINLVWKIWMIIGGKVNNEYSYNIIQ
jgi:hypothetical protein